MNPCDLVNVSICEMSENDVDQVLQIQTETGLSVWSFHDYAKEIENPDSIKKVAKLDDRVIGFALVRITPGSDATVSAHTSSEIYNIAVSETFQDRGIGQKLFDQIVVELKMRSVREVWLEVRESNKRAIKFYKRNGFVEKSIRKNYYKNPLEDAYILNLSI